MHAQPLPNPTQPYAYSALLNPTQNAHAFRVALGHVFGRRGAAAANSMMLLPPAAVT